MAVPDRAENNGFIPIARLVLFLMRNGKDAAPLRILVVMVVFVRVLLVFAALLLLV